MSKVYLIMNYNYYKLEDYKEDRDFGFEDPNVTYPCCYDEVYFSLEDARQAAMDKALDEGFFFGEASDGKDRYETESHLFDEQNPHVAVIFNEDTTDDGELRVSVYAIHSPTIVKFVPGEGPLDERKEEA